MCPVEDLLNPVWLDSSGIWGVQQSDDQKNDSNHKESKVRYISLASTRKSVLSDNWIIQNSVPTQNSSLSILEKTCFSAHHTIHSDKLDTLTKLCYKFIEVSVEICVNHEHVFVGNQQKMKSFTHVKRVQQMMIKVV